MSPRFLPNPFQKALPSPYETAGFSREESETISSIVDESVLDECNNSQVHPAAFLLDTSVSMKGPCSESGTPIEQLNCGLKTLATEIRKDPLLVDSLSLGVAGLVSHEVVHFEMLHPFCHPSEFYPKTIAADCKSTPLCQAISEFVDTLLTVRKAVTRVAGREQKKQWLMVFSDGAPTDPEHAGSAIEAIKLAGKSGICVYFFGVGERADLGFMNRLAQKGRPAQLMPHGGWSQYFSWFHCSVSKASISQANSAWDEDGPFGGKLLMET